MNIMNTKEKILAEAKDDLQTALEMIKSQTD
jgi:hypothetical protein